VIEKKNTTRQIKSRKVQKRPQKKKVQRTKKTKKGLPSDIWQAVLLTGTLIVISVIISMVVLKTGSTSTLDIAFPVDLAPSEIADLSETMIPPEITPFKTVPLETAPLETAALEIVTLETKNIPVYQQPQEEIASTLPISKVTPIPHEKPVVPNLQPTKKNLGTLVFIIDDAGNSLQELEPFLRFPGPLTIAVLPGLPHSAEAARRVRAAGKDLFLHQPMEALGGQPPGPGAIYAGMGTVEILAVLKRNIAEIGPVTGMNNHQGSKITMDQQAMETILAFCREQGIHFLDSRTTTQTAVPAAAKNLGIKIGERNIFIDNDPDRLSMNRSIQDGLSLAVQKGSAVMIGHVQSPELAPLLTDLHQGLINQGYTFATASGFITQKTATN
jgi:polysaccharide deacetylase 2 family uncharacterized protein YibQ